MVIKTNCIPDKSLMSEKDKKELWDILCLSNNEFVPPLSSRNSATQQDFTQNMVTDKPIVYFEELLEHMKVLCMDDSLTLNQAVYESEHSTGFRNRSIAYLLKSKGILQEDVEETLELYFKLCSIQVTAKSLAGFGLLLANNGVQPFTGERLIDENVVKTIKTLMLTCGMYDGSGEFAVKIGMPAKSGVGGGVLSFVNGRAGIGVFGPSLDEKGNSIAGVKILEYLSKELNLHIFDSNPMI